MNQFEAIRQYRRVPAFRGRVVTYHGQRYRIAAVSDTGGLVLRSQHIVHPKDPNLKYDGRDGIDCLKQHIAEESMKLDDWLNSATGDHLTETYAVRRSFLRGLETALRLVEKQAASE